MNEKQRKNKLIEDLCYQNGYLNARLIQKNIKIAERIKLLVLKKYNASGKEQLDLINEEINWLIKLADI